MDTFDKYRENKATEKMFGEMATWARGDVMKENLKGMLKEAGIRDDEMDLEDGEQLNLAARMLLQDILGQHENREVDDAHLKYDQLKKSLRFSHLKLLPARCPP